MKLLKNILKKLKIALSKNIFDELSNIVLYLCGNEALPMPLEPDEEQILIEEMQKGNEQAKEKLIEHNLRLVVYIAKRFENTGVDLEDLISVGAIGLIKAVQTYDFDKKIKLATYASRCIENEILMQLRKTTKQKLEVSLDEPLNFDSDGNELLLSDVLSSEEDSVSKNLDMSVEKQILWNSISKLGRREQDIMKLRFGLGGYEEKTQKEVADMLGISQSYISRIEKKILVKMRAEIQKAGNE